MSKFDQRVEEVVDSRIEDLRDLFLADDPEVVLQALRRIQDDLQDDHHKVMNLLQGLKDEVQKIEHRQEQQEEKEKKEEVERQKEEVTNKVKDTVKRLLDGVYNVVTDALVPDSLTPFLNQIGSILGLPEIPTNVVELGSDILDPVIERLQDPIGTAAKLADILYKMQMKSTLDAISDSLMGTNARIQKLESGTQRLSDIVTGGHNGINDKIELSHQDLKDTMQNCCEGMGNNLNNLNNKIDSATQGIKDSVQNCCNSMGDKLQELGKGKTDQVTRGMVSEVKSMVQSLMTRDSFNSPSGKDELGGIEVEELTLDYP